MVDRENARIQVFDAAGTFLREWSTQETPDLGAPRGITISPDGLVWVTDRFLGKAHAFTQQGVLVRTVGEHGEALGRQQPWEIRGDGPVGVQAVITAIEGDTGIVPGHLGRQPVDLAARDIGRVGDDDVEGPGGN